METTLRVVNCPCCMKMLYALGLDKTREGASWQMTPDSPAVQNDAEGHFIMCGSCRKRVAIEEVSAAGHARWVVSAKQKCS